MIGELKAEFRHEWDVIRPVLVKNVILKITILVVAWMIHSSNVHIAKGNVLMNMVFNPTGSALGKGIVTLAEWDGLYFIDATLHGYRNLKQFAFYPGFPTAVKTLVAFFTSLPGVSSLLHSLSPALVALSVGCSLNFFLHLANNWLLYKWLRARGFAQRHASFAALTFGLGGNALYHLAFYSESSYMFVTLLSLWALAKADNDPVRLSLGRFVALTLFFACSGFVRSVGLVNGAYLGYPLLLELVYVSVRQRDLRRAADVLGRMVFVVVCFFTPAAFLFVKTRRLFCHGATAEDPDYVAPGFCDSPTGFFYGYIQEKYWSVRLFDYFQNFHHMDGWIWAFVTFTVVSIWLKKAYQNAGFKGLFTIHLPEYLSNHNLMSSRILEMPDLVIFTMQYIGYYAYAHLGSIERFWSATPAYYMFLISAQQVLVRASTPKDNNTPSRFGLVKLALQYLLPFSLTARQILVPVWHAARVYPI